MKKKYWLLWKTTHSTDKGTTPSYIKNSCNQQEKGQWPIGVCETWETVGTQDSNALKHINICLVSLLIREILIKLLGEVRGIMVAQIIK